MWWKLAGLGLVAAGLIALLVAPIAHVDVTVNLPPAVGLPTASQADTITILVILFSLGLIVSALGVIVWMARQVIRHHRKSTTPQA